jgi:hypothetical protein
MLRQPVRKAPLMRDLSWEKKGVQSGAALPYLLSEASLKAAPAAPILATEHKLHRLAAPRSASKKKTGSSCHIPYSGQYKLHICVCRFFSKKNSKEFNAELADCSLGKSEPQHPSAMQKLPSRIAPEPSHCRPAVGSIKVLRYYTVGLPKKYSATRYFKL